MERLTEKTVGCFEYALKDHKAVPGEFCTYDAFFDYSMAVKRLGHYEDLMERWKLRSIEEADRIFQRVNALGGTDLMAQYRSLGSIDHLRDLLQAEQDGRLVVLPCKVVCGTTIWWADSNFHANPIKCEVGSFGIYTGPDGDLQVWMNCYVYGSAHMSKSFRMSSIGKTVFLTREEAEAALAQEGVSDGKENS